MSVLITHCNLSLPPPSDSPFLPPPPPFFFSLSLSNLPARPPPPHQPHHPLPQLALCPPPARLHQPLHQIRRHHQVQAPLRLSHPGRRHSAPSCTCAPISCRTSVGTSLSCTSLWPRRSRDPQSNVHTPPSSIDMYNNDVGKRFMK